MIKDSEISRSIDNSIRSLFQMIVVVKDSDGECVIFDRDKELANISCPEGSDKAGFPFEILRRELIKNIHPADREAFDVFTVHDNYVRELKDHVHLSLECRLRHTDSRYYWSEIIICNTTAVNSTEGNDSLFMIRDIDARKTGELDRETEEKEVLKKLQDRYDALFEENMTDQQTGCYNRKGLKHLNDTYGHAAGDEAIRAVSQELKKAAPSGSKVVRIGGDEFMIFASVEKNSSEPGSFGEKVDRGIEAYNRSYSNPYEVGTSYGWVLLPPKKDMKSLDEYIEMADAKMYEMRVERDRYRRD